MGSLLSRSRQWNGRWHIWSNREKDKFHADTHTHGNPDFNTDSYSYINVDSHSNSDVNADSYAYSNSHCHTYPCTDSHSNTDGYTKTYSDSQASSYSAAAPNAAAGVGSVISCDQ